MDSYYDVFGNLVCKTTPGNLSKPVELKTSCSQLQVVDEVIESTLTSAKITRIAFCAAYLRGNDLDDKLFFTLKIYKQNQHH